MVRLLISERMIFMFLWELDSVLPTYVTLVNNHSSTLRSSIKCARQIRSPLPQPSTDHLKSSTKRRNESAHEQQQQEPVKRIRLSSRPVEDNNQNSNRIVLRIRKPSEDHSSNRSDASNNSSSNHQISIQIKELLETVKEDEDEDHMESQTSNVFDIFNQNSNLSSEEQESSQMSPKSQSLSPPPPVSSVDETVVEKPVVIDPDVILVLDTLLDNVDALKAIEEVPSQEMSADIPSTNELKSVQLQFAERRTTTKQPRKSRLQQRIITPEPKSTPPSTLSLPPIEQHLNEQSLSPATPTISLRTLSSSPAKYISIVLSFAFEIFILSRLVWIFL